MCIPAGGLVRYNPLSRKRLRPAPILGTAVACLKPIKNEVILSAE